MHTRHEQVMRINFRYLAVNVGVPAVHLAKLDNARHTVHQSSGLAEPPILLAQYLYLHRPDDFIATHLVVGRALADWHASQRYNLHYRVLHFSNRCYAIVYE